MENEIEFLENNIIASFLVDKDTYKYIRELETDFFSCAASKKIYKVIKYLYLNKQEINIITVKNKLSNGTDGVVILQKLVKITDSIITTASIETYIDKLVDINTRARINNLLISTFKELKDPNTSVLDIKNNLVKQIRDIKDNCKIDVSDDVQTSFSKTLELIEKKNNKIDDYSFYTGFFDLDKLTDGLHENELTAIGARPGVGKTAFAINIASNIANKGKNVYFCSLEMSSEQLMERIIANYCNINTQFLRNGRLQTEEMQKIAEGANKILDLNLKIDSKTRYIEDLENIIINLKEKDEIDLLIVDYLTLLKSKNKFAIRELEVAEISRKLKLLALDLKIPIIILVQLNRDAENKVPSMANIRESGSIEQNCDNIIFLHNENNEKTVVEEITVILEKQRQGTTGVLKLKFNKKYSKFINYER